MQHVRNPYRLSDSEYQEFGNSVRQFLADQRSLPNRPEHLVQKQLSDIIVFAQKLDEYNTAISTKRDATNDFEAGVAELLKILRRMRNILPTLSDENILIPFGLDKDIPLKYAELINYCDVANTYWQTVRNDPLFLPVLNVCDQLGIAVGKCENLRALQITAIARAELLQNEKKTARDNHNDVERKIFNWYRSFYPDPKDDYWTMTPWGRTSNVPQVDIPAPKNFTLDGEFSSFSWEAVSGATKYVIERKIINENEFKFFAETKDIYYDLTKIDFEEQEFRICAHIDDKRGDYSTPIRVKYKKLPLITNFRFAEDEGKLRWDDAVGTRFYLVKCNGEEFGERVWENSLDILPMPSGTYRFSVAGYGFYCATDFSPEIIVIIPQFFDFHVKNYRKTSGNNVVDLYIFVGAEL